jgi:O-antigen ligase
MTSSAPSARTGGQPSAAAFADAAAFSVVVSSAIVIPAIFSIALPDVFALPKTILAVALAALLVVLLMIRLIATWLPLRRPRSSLAVALGVFVGWNLVAAWFAIDRTQAIFGERLQYQGLATILAYVVFLLAAWTTVRGPRRQGIFLLSAGAGAALVATYAVIQRAGLDPIWFTLPYDRVFSTIGQANALAAYLVVATALVLALAAGRRRASQLAVGGVVVLMLVALAFTLSRGGYLGIAAVALVLVIAALRKRERLTSGRQIAAAALVGLVALMGVLAVPELRTGAERVVARAVLTTNLSESSILSHLDLWRVGLAIATDHPLVGTGQDTYVLLFGEYRDHVLSAERAVVMSVFRPESPHNVYLATAAGAGLPALAAYVAIVAAAVARILAAMRTAVDPRAWLVGAALLAAIVGHLVTDAFMTAETTGSVLFWMLLGVGAGHASTNVWPDVPAPLEDRARRPEAHPGVA